jgi:hypothetical protein
VAVRNAPPSSKDSLFECCETKLYSRHHNESLEDPALNFEKKFCWDKAAKPSMQAFRVSGKVVLDGEKGDGQAKTH